MTDERSTKIMTAIFRDRDAAERAYGALMNRGYKSKDVNLLMSNETRERCFPRTERETTELGSKAKEGAGIGAVAGGGLGALLAGMAASGIAVPLLPIIASGRRRAGTRSIGRTPSRSGGTDEQCTVSGSHFRITRLGHGDVCDAVQAEPTR